MLWRCWAAGRASGLYKPRGGCWRGYLSGARYRLAYGPADATATHCLLLQYRLTRVVPDKGLLKLIALIVSISLQFLSYGTLSPWFAIIITTSGQRILTKGRIVPQLSPPRRLSPSWSLAFVVTLCPCGQGCSPMLLPRLLLTQSNAFQWGTTPNCPPPWGGSRPHLINTWYGSLGPAESTSLTASRLVQSFCVQQTHTDRPRSVCIYQQAASLHAIRKVAHTRLPSVVFRS